MARTHYQKVRGLQEAAGEHAGEALPGWMKLGTGDWHPRLTLILDTTATRAIPNMDDATLGRLVRMGVLQAVIPGLSWTASVDAACCRADDPKRARRVLRALLRRYCAESLER